jgi:hypothetical protein
MRNCFWGKQLPQRLCLVLLLAVSLTWAWAQPAHPTATIQRVAVVGDENGLGVAITSSAPVTPVTQVLEGPDRVVMDFPNAVPGSQLHNIQARQGDLKAVRISLFSNNPPTTRVVLDLSSASGFQVIPSGNTVVVTLGDSPTKQRTEMAAPRDKKNGEMTPARETMPLGGASITITRRPVSRPPAAAPVVVSSVVPTPKAAIAPAQPVKRLLVDFSNGLLSIDADQATLSEVLYEVQRRTGADVAIPAGAERDKVVIKAGPGSPKDVMAALLNGSHFNFILVGSMGDKSGVRSVILTPKTGGPSPPSPSETPDQPGPDQQPLAEGVGDGTPPPPTPPPGEVPQPAPGQPQPTQPQPQL